MVVMIFYNALSEFLYFMKKVCEISHIMQRLAILLLLCRLGIKQTEAQGNVSLLSKY